MPRVSVLMSSYNHETFVAEAIRSVLEQDCADWELIIRDDGSTDRTGEVTAGFTDPRIRHLGSGPRVGGAASLNRCLHHATGEFIAIMNSDDALMPQRLSTQVAILDSRPEAGAAFSHAEMVDERGHPCRRDDSSRNPVFTQPNRTRHEWLRFFFQKGNCLCHPSALIRRRVFDDTGFYDPLMQQLPDFDLWVRLCARHEIHVHQAPLLRFRLMEDGSNASADTPTKRGLLSYEQTKVLDRFASNLLMSQLHEIFPEWIAPDESEEARLLGLARAALAVSSPPHHFFALDCLREHVRRGGIAKTTAVECEEKLLEMALCARPFVTHCKSSAYWRIFYRRSGEAGFTQREAVITRPVISGASTMETLELPRGTVQLSLEFDGAYQSLEIYSLAIIGSDGREIWSVTNPSQDGLQITGARLVEATAGGLKLVRQGGRTRIELPELAGQDQMRLRCSLRIRHDVQDLIRERETLAKNLKAAEKHQARLQKDLASAVEWQKRSWLRRALGRWKLPSE